MEIQVSQGIGTGPTELSAFDQALVKASVANFNLIYLSSVLPPGSDVFVTDQPKSPEGGWGDKLYVVMAEWRTSTPGSEAWAGIGWIQDEKTKHGLLVEHEGDSEAQVRSDIENSLAALAENRQTSFGPPQMHIAGTKCEDRPVCALVVAVFESATWQKLQPARSRLSFAPMKMGQLQHR